MNRCFLVFWAASSAVACVPSGSAPPSDAGASKPSAPAFRPSVHVMTAPFEDTFDRADAKRDAGTTDAGKAIASDAAGASDAEAREGAVALDLRPRGPDLGPDWVPARPGVWRIEGGKLCAQGARNQGIWLQRTLPVNARIEFDALSDSNDGDLKAEVWGDGRSSATGISYNNATSYLVIFGGWKNTLHVLARLDEHGADRKEIRVDKASDDAREQPVARGQVYHFRIERSDGKTVRWSVNGVEYLTLSDPSPLVGMGHDHFGFNDWDARVCFDNVRVTPL